MRIALVSDTHVRTDDAPQARAFRAHFEEAVAQINAANVDVVFVAGDTTEDGTPDQTAVFQKIAGDLHAPYTVVPGNHDIGAKHLPTEPDAGVTQKRVDDWEACWGPSWTTDVNGVRFIGINTSVLGSGLPCEAAQWEFLQRELARASETSTVAVVVQHYPAYLETPKEPGGDYWNLEPAPRQRWLDLLARYPVTAVLSGHIHRGLDIYHGKTRLITTPPVSFGLPFGEQPEGWTLVTVNSETGETTAEFCAVSHTA